MVINHRIERNSGATLEPCIYKYGPGVYEQGVKMQAYGGVFPEVKLLPDGYIMQVLKEPGKRDLVAALEGLMLLWESDRIVSGQLTHRASHHLQQVKPYADQHSVLYSSLAYWYHRVEWRVGRKVNVVHGDPTLENYMDGGVWLDPSIRPMPLEAELDGGKLLQSYFGYRCKPGLYEKETIKTFLREQDLDLDLCAYYLVTHVVRLFRVQKDMREWAIDLLTNLEERVKELECK